MGAENAIAYGQIGEAYEAFAKGEKKKVSLVGFEGTVLSSGCWIRASQLSRRDKRDV